MRRILPRCIISRTFRRISFRVDIYVPPISQRVYKKHREVKRSKCQGQQNKHRRFLERSNEVTPFHPASRLKSSGRKFVHAAGKTREKPRKSTSSTNFRCWRTLTCVLPLVLSFFFFDIGQSLLADFDLCAPTRLVFF